MFKKSSALTMMELIVSIIIMSLMILGIYHVETFSTTQAIDADRRARVQNELAYALEHMTKYVQKANGNFSRKAIEAIINGFRVYIDFNDPQTSSVFTDDGWIDYTLTTNTLTATCNGNGGTCAFTGPENLSNKIVANTGFQVTISPLGNLVEIVLDGRWKPDLAVITGTRFANPQVEMKTQIICNSSSTN